MTEDGFYYDLLQAIRTGPAIRLKVGSTGWTIALLGVATVFHGEESRKGMPEFCEKWLPTWFKNIPRGMIDISRYCKT